MPRISVYMPVYNAGRFLKQAVSSVLEQDMGDFEFYIHDDGSTDGSYEACVEYAASDDRIILEKGENGSSKDSMSKFLLTAKGEYIAFVDHDDYIDRTYFTKMLEAIQKTGSDVAISSYTAVDSENRVLDLYSPTLKDGEVLTREEVCVRFLTTFDVEGFRWNKIFRKSVFVDNGVAFDEPFPGDIPIEFKLLTYVDGAVMVNSRGYHYRQSTGSEVATMNEEKLTGFLETFGRVGERAKSMGLVREGEYYHVWRTVSALFNAFKGRKRYGEQAWSSVRKRFSLKGLTGKSAVQVFATVLRFRGSRDSRVKILIKALVVEAVFG